MFRVILCIQFYRLMQLIFSTLLNEGKNLTSMAASGQAYESLSWRCATEGYQGQNRLKKSTAKVKVFQPMCGWSAAYGGWG